MLNYKLIRNFFKNFQDIIIFSLFQDVSRLGNLFFNFQGFASFTGSVRTRNILAIDMLTALK